MQINTENVKVFVRCRPLLEENGQNSIINIESKTQLTISSNGTENAIFNFEQIFDNKYSQEEIYKSAVYQLVEDVFQGYDCTVLVYGQLDLARPLLWRGIIPRACNQVMTNQNLQQFQIEVSHIMIYNEKIYDHLNKCEIKQIRESKVKGIYIEGLTETLVSNLQEIEETYESGKKQQMVIQTYMSLMSSRWCSMFKIQIKNKVKGTIGNLNLVDLAGSEIRKEQKQYISCSIAPLSQVVGALTDGTSKHVPYRNSKLTRLLTNSLGGNCKSVLIATINSSNDNREETFRTLYFARRAQKIINKSIINYFQEQELQNQQNISQPISSQIPLFKDQKDNDSEIENNQQLQQFINQDYLFNQDLTSKGKQFEQQYPQI